MTLGIMDTADGMTLGTMADTMAGGTEAGTIHTTDTCTLTTPDGTVDGTHIGATTITIYIWVR